MHSEKFLLPETTNTEIINIILGAL